MIYFVERVLIGTMYFLFEIGFDRIFTLLEIVSGVKKVIIPSGIKHV